MPARKRNPGMRAHGYETTPAGPMRRVDTAHLGRQETIGLLFLLAAILAVVWALCWQT